MSREEHIANLLSRWQAGRARGCPPTPEELCRDCPELLPELRRRLEAPDSLAFLLQTPGIEAPTVPPSTAAGLPLAEAPGPMTTAGMRYRQLRLHARGGLGEVYVGLDEELRREVALKRIQPSYAGHPEARRRFLREAEVTSRLEHPGVVPVYGLAADADGAPCYAMRFIQGESLRDALRRFHEAGEGRRDSGERRLAFRDLLTRFAAVCQTLAYAHSRGILHRDLKPDNIMLGRYGETLVVDWGLARPVRRTERDRAGGEDTLLPALQNGGEGTQLGQVVGTPAYMSPEQAAGRWDVVGPASDVYSLGATLYELLTGRPPFQARTPLDTLLEVIEKGPKPPRQVRPDVPAALQAVCLKAMARRPEERYPTAAELAAEVERWLADEPVSAWREPWHLRAGRRVRRHQAAVAAAMATVLVAILLGSGGAFWLERQQAERRAEQARQHERLRQGIEAALEEVTRLQGQGRWAEARAVLAQAGSRLGEDGSADLSARLDQARRDLALVARLEAIRLARVAVGQNNGLDFAGSDRRYAEAFAEAGLGASEDAAALAERIRGSAVRGVLVAALDDWAVCAQAESRRAWLLEAARRADPDPWRDRFRDPAHWQDRAALERLAGEPDVAVQSPQVVVALAIQLREKGGDAVGLLRRKLAQHPEDFWLNFELGYALQDRDPVGAAGSYRAALVLRPDSAAVRNNLGKALLDQGRLEEAVTEYQRAIALDPRFAFPHNGLGNALRDLGRPGEALTAYQRAIALSPGYAAPHNGLVYSLADLGRPEEAMTAYRQAIALDPGYALPHNNLGNVLKGQGQLEEALAEYRRAIDLDPKSALPHHGLAVILKDQARPEEAIAEYRRAIALDPKYAAPHNNLGSVLNDQGRLEEALVEFGQTLALDPKFALPHVNLGNALKDRGRLEEALAEYRRASDLDPKLATPHNNLGETLSRLGRLEEAVAEYRRAIELDPKFAFPHNNLGNACWELGRLREAEAEYHQAIALDPKYAAPHNGLGNTLSDQGRLEEAMAEYHQAIALDPKNAYPHNNLGNALSRQGRLDEAMAEYRRAIALNPRFAFPHNGLGNALRDRGRLEEAVAEYRRAIALDTKYSHPHNGLGDALADQGRLEEARQEYQRAVDLGHKQAAERLRRCERQLALTRRLPAVLRGEDQSATAAEWLDFALLCQQPYQKRYAAAARFYGEAFTQDARLAEDMRQQHRYNAACAAALAGAGQGADAGQLDDKERARLRKQALDWLRADLAYWAMQAEGDAPQTRARVQQTLTHWQADADLAGLRDKQALAILPEAEREACTKLWSDVAALLQRVGKKN